MSKNGICGIRSYTQSGVDNLTNLTNGLSGLPGAAVRQAEGVEGEGERAGEERRRSQGSMLQNFFAIFGYRWIVAGSVANHIKPLRS